MPIGFSGANFAIAESGSVCVVESEGNGRMCVTLPEVLITMVGMEKIIPTFNDLEVFLQLLARSATGERMNPYNSIWTGVTPGDGPHEFHVVLLDNGRTGVLADRESRETLDCIRCGACLNICPVYRQTGGHAYGSIYAGPIGAILTPQLQSMEHSQSLPYASSLCGACYEVCPVKIDIPEILIHLRSKVVESGGAPLAERLGMRSAAAAMTNGGRLESAQKLARIAQKPLVHDGVDRAAAGDAGGWTRFRDMRPIPAESFRHWWAARQSKENEMSAARRTPDGILERIRKAVGGAGDRAPREYAAIPREYRREGAHGGASEAGAVRRPALRLRHQRLPLHHGADRRRRGAGAQRAAPHRHRGFARRAGELAAGRTSNSSRTTG